MVRIRSLNETESENLNMAEIFGLDHKPIAACALVAAVGVAVVSGVSLYVEKSENEKLRKEVFKKETHNVYESQKLLNEYMHFHYSPGDELLVWDFGPTKSVDFMKRVADICIEFHDNSDGVPSRALDIGCAVGRASFELARVFNDVVGIDYSQSFVDACKRMKHAGEIYYDVTDEGHVTSRHRAVIDSSLDRNRVSFQRGDACDLSTSLGSFGCVLAANLICRLPEPRKFLNRLPSLVAPGGIVVITAPYSWMTEFTEKSKWLGGYRDTSGQVVTSFDTLKKELGANFDLIAEKNVPFLIRETIRKYQWTVAHGTVWRRRN